MDISTYFMHRSKWIAFSPNSLEKDIYLRSVKTTFFSQKNNSQDFTDTLNIEFKNIHSHLFVNEWTMECHSNLERLFKKAGFKMAKD